MKIHPPQHIPATRPDDPDNGYQDWTVELDDGCQAFVRTATGNDMLRIVSVAFTCPDGEPSTNTFRLLKLGDFRLHVLDWMRNHPELLEPPYVAFLRDGLDQGWTLPDRQEGLVALLEQSSKSADITARRLRKGPAKGRGARSPDFHRATALMYLRFLPEHGQRVVIAMAKELRRSPNTVSTWVRRARDEGWLSKSTQGKAGGEPGPKLIEWMREQEENE